MKLSDSSGMSDCSSSNTQPSFLVVKVRTKRAPQLRPVLIIGTRDGEIAIPREPAEWILYILQYQACTPVEAMLTTIGRLYQYASIAFEAIELTADTLPLVVWNYIAFRVGERIADDPDSQHLPLWNPVKRTTALSEFKTIVDYLRFCDDRFQTLPLLARPQRLRTFSDFDVPTASKRDFFLHCVDIASAIENY
jgi:hypothetical protein